MARLKDLYKSKIVAELTKEFNYTNPMAVPKIEKVVVSMGVGRAIQDKRILELAKQDLTLIAGQVPVVCKAKKSVSNFKLREGMPVGVKVTLRKDRMYDFIDRLITVALPRVRDFRGLSPKSFDGRGNFALGIREHIVFPEIDYDKVDEIWGLDVVVCTTAPTDDEGRALLKQFNFPFRN